MTPLTALTSKAAAAALLLLLLAAGPAAAQSGAQAPAPAPAGPSVPLFRVRGFGMIAEQWFTASQTFEATLGHRAGLFLGGGGQVVIRDGLYVDVAVSRFSKDGHRAFRFNGQDFDLGIPLTATITPVELTGGYRFLGSTHRLIPFAGGGVGWYSYQETSSFATSGENLDTTHTGFLAVGGVEIRASRWIAFSVDGQYTHVPGILGDSGISADAGEKDLGGIAARAKVIVTFLGR